MLTTSVLAGTISIEWDPATDADLVGYRIYYGTASRGYDQHLDVGRLAETTLQVDDCTNYFVAVKARDAAGHLSDGYSSELSGYASPRLALLTPAIATQGSEMDVVLTGVNFRSGATVRFGNPGISVSSVDVDSCRSLTAHIRMSAAAPVGLSSVEVVNPDDTYATGLSLFSVLPSPTTLSVTSTNPPSGADGVSVGVHPLVTFSQQIRATSVSAASVRLIDESGRVIAQAPGSPVIGPGGTAVMIVPAQNLAFESDYRIHVLGGSSGVLDSLGRPLPSSFLEDPPFTTEEDTSSTDLAIAEISVTPQATSADISWSTSLASTGRVFYRKVGDPDYQVSPPETDRVTRHWVQITNLEPSTDYAFYVECEDAHGNTAASTPDTRFLTSQYVYLRIEAESARLTLPIRKTTGRGAFRGAWIDTPPGAPRGSADHPAGTAEIQFFVPGDDTWHVFVRLYGLDDTTDSWFVSVDDATPHQVAPSVTPGWTWTGDGAYQLSRGEHVLTLGGRESETRADRVLITNDPDFVPDAQPGSDTQPPLPPQNLSADLSDDAVDLTWTNPVSDAVRIVVRYRTDGTFPVNPWDGMPVGMMSSVILNRSTMRHNGTGDLPVCWYSLFAVDGAGNASEAARIRVAR